ncbi:MAG TPA: putative toxin-antitoxin system toxin component, PIN family [Flavobacteriaceae bacterium]|nr:putative toxin-antitoxin system toxin component, PIN family [Flavobacteriaceae bacterium]
MHKIIIDTNVLVSSLIQRGYPFQILIELFSNDNIELCISYEVLKEYFDVLNRKKFARFTDFAVNAQTLLVDIEKRGVEYFPTSKVEIIKDLDDNKFLELAETCKADFLITGNTKDFTLDSYKNTKIVSPKEYCSSTRSS